MPYTEGDLLRDLGHRQVLEKEQEAKQQRINAWLDGFDFAGLAVLKAKGWVTSEDITDRIGPPPYHPSAVGAAMRRFALSLGLVIDHYEKARNARSHSAVVAVWVRKP